MKDTNVNLKQLAAMARRFAQRLLTIGENRLELLTLEVQEERQRLLHAFLLALGVAAFGLLASIALTAAVVVAFWEYSPVLVLLIMTVLYGSAGVSLSLRLTRLLRDLQTFPATMDQLRKDRACLAKILE
ncbi:MAG: phage holin family protein [Verrucomicrobiota bacterium]|nr:phage holin family protein [Verrucomicrobiota bacterium]